MNTSTYMRNFTAADASKRFLEKDPRRVAIEREIWELGRIGDWEKYADVRWVLKERYPQENWPEV